jgi:polyhydroxybutyrate depolymerase
MEPTPFGIIPWVERDGTALERRTLDVGGLRRTYWLAGRPDGGRGATPLLVLLHGSGTTGRDVATTFTGLATRGPAAGVTAVFPDGWRGVWHVTGAPPAQPDLDDAAFLRALVSHLQEVPRPVFLAGLSNGAGFAEHVARHALLPVAGLFLVSGTIREASRQAGPVPAQRTAVTLMAGTADPAVAYQGGPLRAPGVAGWILRRRAARHGDLPSQRRTVPVETVARDWAAGNGITGEPAQVRLPGAAGDPPAVRLTWSAPRGAQVRPPVVLYRIEGGGHGWPGGPQYLPARVIGRVPRHLDATKILLDSVTLE